MVVLSWKRLETDQSKDDKKLVIVLGSEAAQHLIISPN